jgi:hypothetical protein
MLAACEKEDAAVCGFGTEVHPLDGEWHLISVTCECPTVLLEPGDNIWAINVAAGTLEVEDNTTGDLPAVPESGSYSLIVSGDSLFYQLPYGYRYSIEDGDLILDQESEVDGPLVRLIRP